MTTLAARPVDTGTSLAIDRTRLAYERTMMAGIGAFALIAMSFGL